MLYGRTAHYITLHSFKQRFFPYTSPITSRRFLENTEIYLNAVAKEAELREKCVILDSATYDNLRRENSGVPYSFALFGYTLGADLPDKVFNHPIFQEMYLAAVDMVTRSNVSGFFPFVPPLLLILNSIMIGLIFVQHRVIERTWTLSQ